MRAHNITVHVRTHEKAGCKVRVFYIPKKQVQREKSTKESRNNFEKNRSPKVHHKK